MNYMRYCIILGLFCIAAPSFADDFADTKKLFEEAGVGDLFNSAYGYALFPLIGKGGFVVGGAYGEGRVYEQGNWVGETKMIQASVGFQLGGTGFSQVIFFQDQRAMAEFVSGDFEFEAEAQATVLTAAASVSASTGGSSATASGNKDNVVIAEGGYSSGMATYTITKGGLMYEASIGGQKFSFSRR